ncbi:hypothetical protein DMH20_05985 [Escherichia coli]|nr:hypothetical protein [Escherichia coli]
MAMGHVILKEFHLDNPSDYFINYCRRYSDMPMLVMLEPRDDSSYVPGRMVRASDRWMDWAKAIILSGKPWQLIPQVNW